MDCYRSMHDIKRAFLDFMDRVPFYGMVVACNDDPILRRMLPKVRRRMVSYGTRRGSDFHIGLRESNTYKPETTSAHVGAGALTRSPRTGTSGATCFGVRYGGKELGEFHLHVPGLHNVLNATAAIAVGIGLDIPVAQIREALENFRGVDRRFQIRGKVAGVTVIDDYGHHPTEIRATLAAARQCGYRNIHVIFQPHRYTRTRDLMDEFATAFTDADSLAVLDIYPANEQPIEGITGEALAGRIREKGNREPAYAGSFEDSGTAATAKAQEGEIISTLGAGPLSHTDSILL